MPAEGRENPLLKKGNSDAFFREKYLTKNNYCLIDTEINYIMGMIKPIDPIPIYSAIKELSNYKLIIRAYGNMRIFNIKGKHLIMKI